MEPPSDTGGTPSASGSGASARSAGGAEAPTSSSSAQQPPPVQGPQPLPQQPPQPPSRYESQKRRDWNTFLQYLRNHKPPLTLQRCSGAHVIEFLRYLDQFGKTKVHADSCPHFGKLNPPEPCACPLKQAWGSLDALIGRLRAAYEESGGRPESNPFAARAVRMYLREVRESQAKARGIPYEKKKRKRTSTPSSNLPAPGSSSGATSSAPPESSATPEKPELSEEGTPDEEKPSPSPRATASATITVTTAATGTTAAAGATTSRREAKGKGRSSSGGS